MEKAIQEFEKELVAENYRDYKMYVSRATEFMLWLNDNNINDWSKVRTYHVTQFFEYLKVKPKKNGGVYKAETLNKYRDMIKKFSAFMQACKIAYFSMLIPKFKDQEITKYEPAILSLDQIKTLFQTIDEMGIWLLSDRDKVMLHLLYSCGMRIQEVQNLNIEDLYLESGYIHVKHGEGRRIKNGRERKVIVLPEVGKVIEEYIQFTRLTMLGNREERALLINYRSKRLGKQSFEDRLKAIIEVSGNEELQNMNVTPHCFRHSLASHLLQAGMSVQDVQFLLGHSSADSTDRYIHLLNKKYEKKKRK